MSRAVSRVAAALFLFLFAPARADMATRTAVDFDPAAFTWAYGLVIDTLSVSGNDRTQSMALLREMESRVGDRLERKKLERDYRYLGDLSSIATVDLNVYPVREGYCGLELHVTERPPVLLKLIYPILEYDFNSDRWRYGLRINDRNFRRRLETLSAGYTRNSVGDDRASVGWGTRWIGWQHVGLSGAVAYYKRGSTPASLSVVEQLRTVIGGSLPLTESRMSFSQLIARLSLTKNRLGGVSLPSSDEVLVSPGIGYNLDRRDSQFKPARGGVFGVDVQTNRVVNGSGSTYYQLGNDTRVFRSVLPHTVLALQSNLAYQFGKFPEYIRFGLGGAGTLRGYSDGEFEGAHRWFQSAELRVAPFPTWLFSVPYARSVDVTVAGALFVDTGIVWDSEENFTSERWHGGYGFGLLVYSPFQDVARVELAFNSMGHVHFYFSTGIRF